MAASQSKKVAISDSRCSEQRETKGLCALGAFIFGYGDNQIHVGHNRDLTVIGLTYRIGGSRLACAVYSHAATLWTLRIGGRSTQGRGGGTCRYGMYNESRTLLQLGAPPRQLEICC